MDDQQAQTMNRPAHRRSNIPYRIALIVSAILSVIVILLLIRVILAFLGALTESDFVSFIYNVTTPFVEPFRGMFQVSEYQIGNSRLEYEAYVAIVVYMLAGAGVTAIGRALR